jgi:hypothetical protein
MMELLIERRAAVQRAIGETRLHLDTLETQAAQARREIDQLTGALLELNYLLEQLPPEPNKTNEEDCILTIGPSGDIMCNFRDLTLTNSHAFSLDGISYPV